MKIDKKRIVISLLIGLSLSLIYFFMISWKMKKEQERVRDLKNMIINDKKKTADDEDSKREKQDASGQDIGEREKKIKSQEEKYRELIRQNPDFVGWLSIEGTKVDYPVVQRKNEESYYLRRDFYGDYSISGTLFLSAGSDIWLPTDNLIIYGHRMSDGSMFGDLSKYEDENYYNEHRSIVFSSLKEEARYEVAFVFYDRIHSKDYDGFVYYKFTEAENEYEYKSYINACKEKSLIKSGLDPKYGDKLLTLSTCSYHETDGRFVVIAVKK